MAFHSFFFPIVDDPLHKPLLASKNSLNCVCFFKTWTNKDV